MVIFKSIYLKALVNLKLLGGVGNESLLFHEYLSFTGVVDGDSWVKSLSGLLLEMEIKLLKE